MIVLLILLLFIPSLAQATTWYVDKAGGDMYDASNNPSGKCNGQSAALYPGSGTNQSCAVKNIDYIIGLGCDNFGTSCVGVIPLLAAGDIIYINGDYNGVQAQYPIGYDASSTDWFNGNFGNCKAAFPYACTLANLPSGSDSSHRTRIIGIGKHIPQLYGVGTPWQILNAHANHLDIENIEITDHSDCGYNFPTNSCRQQDGIETGGSDVILTNIKVHGIPRYGMQIENSVNMTLTDVWLVANGQGNQTSADIGQGNSFTGTLTWIRPVIDWNGCQEVYPLVGALDSSSNVKNCATQYNNVVADGIAIGYGPNISPGAWKFQGPGSISFNTQDGLDLLHGDGTGTIQLDKMRFEGNAGNQVKINALQMDFTNNIVIADCGWWAGQSIAYSDMSANTGSDLCRADGAAMHFNVTNSSVANIFNNTVVSLGFGAFENKDEQSSGCNGSTAIHLKNNIVYGSKNWQQDNGANPVCSGGCSNTSTLYIYNGGNDGNGTGTCGTLTWDEDYNDVSFTNSSCLGAHDKCATNPSFTGTIGTGSGSLSSYYQGTSGVTQVYLQGGSPAVTAGVSSLTYWNTSNDYHLATRASPPSMGALELSSCAAENVACFFSSDCCSGVCSQNICTYLNLGFSGSMGINGKMGGK